MPADPSCSSIVISQKASELCNFMYKHAYIRFHIFGAERKKTKASQSKKIYLLHLTNDLYIMYEGKYPSLLKIYNSNRVVQYIHLYRLSLPK